MRKLPLLAILLLAFNTTFGQTPEELFVQSDAIYDSNPDSSYTLSSLALELSEQQGDTLQMGYAHVRQGRYYLVKSDVEKASAIMTDAIARVTMSI